LSKAHPRRIGRSLLALLAGFLAVIFLSLCTDVLLHVIGVFPPLGRPMADKLLLLATAYRAVYSVVGTFITARLAPHRPMLHALTGGAIGLVLSIVGAVATWNREPPLGPHWYPLALVALAMPSAWAGGWLASLEWRASSLVQKD